MFSSAKRRASDKGLPVFIAISLFWPWFHIVVLGINFSLALWWQIVFQFILICPIFSVLIPDFDTNDLNTLLPWLYGDGSDEQQPNPELVKAMCVGQPQTFTKMPEGAEDMPARPSVAQYAAAVANREALLKPEVDPRINPMDANSLFQVSAA
mgnify:CR=1 FL=1